MTDIYPLPMLLTRIGLENPPAYGAEGLFELVRAYRQAIPFENLDPLAGQPVGTALDGIFEKIVLQGRGGWCYELNQLFADLLRRIGFDVDFRLARVGYRRPRPGPLTHLVLFVRLRESQWLVDVGFGGPGPAEPLLLIEGETVCHDGSRFFIKREKGEEISLWRLIDGEWAQLYNVTPMEVLPVDLEMASHFLSTWAHSPFRQKFVCVAYDREWSWTLDGGELVQRDAQWVSVMRTPIENVDALQSILASHFRIRPPMPLLHKVWDVAG